MSSGSQVPSSAGLAAEQDASETLRTSPSHAEHAKTLSSAARADASQTEADASEVTADGADTKEGPPAAPLLETTEADVSDVVMDDVAQRVSGDEGSGDVIGDDVASPAAAAAVVEEDAAHDAGEGVTPAVSFSSPETSVSADDGAQVVNSVCSDQSASLCANLSEHNGQSIESDGIKPKPDQTSASTSANIRKQSIENPPAEAPRATSSTDVTMATVNPAPPTFMPAGDTNSSSVSGREVAASGALAMLAGYDSGEDSHDSDLENTAPAMTVDRQGLYRDSLAAPWSGDSEPDSDSTDDSSASSSSSSDSEPAVEIDDKEEEDGETDQARRVFGPMTKGELCLLDLPPIEHLHIVLPEDQCTKVGVITSVVECLVVVQSTPGSSPLDIDSVLFLERGRRPLGRIYDVMGPVSEAAYCVRFNTPQEIAEFDIKPGADVFYAPGSAEYSHFVFVEALRKMRGSDASWWDSNEPPENCLDFSDDEEERSHKRQNRKRPLQEPSGSAEPSSEAAPRPAGRPERGRGRGRGGGGGPPCRPPWMPPPPRNPFYGQRPPGAGPPMRWHQAPPPPPPGPFSRPPPPPPGGFGQPPPPFSGRPLYGLPPSGGPVNQPPPPGLPPSGGPLNQPPPPGLPSSGGPVNQPPPPGLPSSGGPVNQPPPPWSRPSFWGPR